MPDRYIQSFGVATPSALLYNKTSIGPLNKISSAHARHDHGYD